MRRFRFAVPLIVVAGLTGCSSEAEPAEQLPASVIGVDASSGPIQLRDAYILQPVGGDGYQPGSTAIVVFELLNTGGMEHTLSSVESSVARREALYWDRNCDGSAELARAIPLPAEPSEDEQPPTDYYAELIDLHERVSDDVQVPVIFQFAGHPPIEVSLPVADQPTPNERWLCLAEVGPPR